jgi:hypothetical protein
MTEKTGATGGLPGARTATETAEEMDLNWRQRSIGVYCINCRYSAIGASGSVGIEDDSICFHPDAGTSPVTGRKIERCLLARDSMGFCGESGLGYKAIQIGDNR